MAIRVDTAFQAVYIHEPLGHTVPALNTAWTVAGLYRVEADVNADTLIVALYGTTAAGNWVGLYMNADGITCRLEGWNGSGSPVVSSNYTLEVGRDYRLAIDYNGSGTVRMLLDGVAVLTLSFTPNAGTLGERSLQWGGYGELAGYTDCTIARWRMWTAVLTEAEHRREHRSTVPFRTRNLIHDWPMNAGSGRFDDTLPGQPDLADNPAVPCGDGTSFVLRPSVLGTPQFFDLGQTATPGAQTITVPEWAERVVVEVHESDDAGTPDAALSSLTSDFASAFTIDGAVSSTVAQAVAIATATVQNSGTGRTFTPVLAATNPVAGAGCWVTFLQDVGGTFPTDTDKAQATGAGATAATASATGVADGLAIAVDTRLNATSGSYPANQSGWTSLNTGETTGAFTYWASSRIRQKAITSNGTETATTQNTNGSAVAIATVAARALETAAPTVAFPVPGDVTASGSNTASGSWAVNFPAAVAGDMLVVNLAWDDSTTVTAVTPPAGPNGETATAIVSAVASSGTEVRAQAWRYIATGTWSSGTRTFTPNASESWQAHVLRVRAGEFDATTPIGAADTRASAGTAETSMLSPAFSAGSTDGGGRLVMYGAVDDDPVIANAAGWSTLATADLGAVSGTLAARNLETTNSESMAAGDWRIASDSWCTLAYVIRKPSSGTSPTLTTSLSMAIQLARTASASVATAVQAPQQTITSVALAVSAARTAAASVAAAIQQAQASTALVQVAIQAPQSAGTSVATAIQAARTAAADLALAVQAAKNSGVGVDLQVQAPSQVSTAVSLQVQAGASASASVQVAVQALGQASTALAIAVSQAETAGTSLSAGVQVARTGAASAGLAIQAARTAGVGVDLQIQEGSTRALALQAAVQFAASASTALSVAVAQLQTAGVGLAAAISLQNTLGFAVDVAVRAAAVSGFGLSVYVLDESVFTRAPSGAGYLRTTQGDTYRPSTGKQTARPSR